MCLRAYDLIDKNVGQFTCERIRLTFYLIFIFFTLFFLFFNTLLDPYFDTMDEHWHKILLVLILTMVMHQVIVVLSTYFIFEISSIAFRFQI